MRELPKDGAVYKHFKGDRYKIICVAFDVVTKKDVVIYKCVKEKFCKTLKVKFCRPVDEFMSLTDMVKYPQATQKYRFEKQEA